MEEYSKARKLYNFFLKRWLLTVLLITLPSNYLIIIKTFGYNFGLVDLKGSLTFLGNSLFWPLFVFSFVFTSVKTYVDKYNENIKYNGQFVLQKMLSSINAIKYHKLERFSRYISEHHTEKGLNPFENITQPRSQIKRILENIQICLADIFDINRDDIGLSIIYKFDTPENSEWDYLHTMNISNDLSLAVLISEKKTTARQIIDDKCPSLFFPDKRIGIKQDQYFPSLKDRTYENIGSIICRNISITNDHHYVFAVLSITTYGKQICNANDIYSIKRIETMLLPPFENRIRLELSLLYIKNILSVKSA